MVQLAGTVIAVDGLSDDDLKKDDVIANVKQMAKDLGELSRDLGHNGAWPAEINNEINRRLIMIFAETGRPLDSFNTIIFDTRGGERLVRITVPYRFARLFGRGAGYRSAN